MKSNEDTYVAVIGRKCMTPFFFFFLTSHSSNFVSEHPRKLKINFFITPIYLLIVYQIWGLNYQNILAGDLI